MIQHDLFGINFLKEYKYMFCFGFLVNSELYSHHTKISTNIGSNEPNNKTNQNRPSQIKYKQSAQQVVYVLYHDDRSK